MYNLNLSPLRSVKGWSRPKQANWVSKTIALVVGVLAMVFLISVIVWAWTEPGSPPPAGNVPAPINVGSTAQTKTGNLILPNLYLNAVGNEGSVYNVNAVVGYNDLFLRGNSAETSPIYAAGSQLSFYSGGIERWRINSAGSLAIGSVPWARLTSFPSACSAGQYVTAVGSSLTCSTPPGGVAQCSDCDPRFVNVTGDTMAGGLGMSNNNIDNVNNLFINDPGANEGIKWNNAAAGWTIDVSPSDRSNADGDLNLYGTANNIHLWRPTQIDGDLTVSGTGGNVCHEVGGSWYSCPAGGGIGGSGSDNYIPRWSGTSNLENSSIYQTDAGNIGIGTIGPDPNYKLTTVGGGVKAENNSAGQPAGYFSNAGGGPALQTGSGNVIVGGGTGKLTVGTIDPVFEIGGEKYATYVPDFAGGVRIETSGVVKLSSSYKIDFDNLQKGSNLWLFWQASNQNIDDLVVILTSGFDGKVWYEKSDNTVTIYSERVGEVSYRLSAPRIDYENWDNLAKDQTLAGINVTNY